MLWAEWALRRWIIYLGVLTEASIHMLLLIVYLIMNSKANFQHWLNANHHLPSMESSVKPTYTPTIDPYKSIKRKGEASLIIFLFNISILFVKLNAIFCCRLTVINAFLAIVIVSFVALLMFIISWWILNIPEMIAVIFARRGLA